MSGKTIVLIVMWCSLLALAPAHGQNTYAPPRNIDDILAVLDQYKPDRKKVEERKNKLTVALPQTNDKMALARFHWDRARIARDLGLAGQALVDFRLAYEAYPDNDPNRNRIIAETASAERVRGNFKNALDYAQQLTTAPQLVWRFNGHGELVNLQLAMGNLDAAQNEFKRMEAAFESLRLVDYWSYIQFSLIGQIEGARGQLLIAQGKFKEAEIAYRKAWDGYSRFVDQVDYLRSQIGYTTTRVAIEQARDTRERWLAGSLEKQGRFSEAEIHIRNVLRNSLSRFGKYHYYTAIVVTNFSSLLMAQGRYGEAASMISAALEIYASSGAPPESDFTQSARRNYARTLVTQKRWTDALAQYEQTREIRNNSPQSRGGSGGERDWAIALIKTGKAADAVAMLEPIIHRNAERMGAQHYATAELRGFLGMALAQSEQKERAMREFGEAIKVLLSVGASESAEESVMPARTLRLIWIIEAYLDLLAESAGTSVEAAAEAFRIADIARGSQVQRALSASAARAAIADPRLAEVAREEQDTATRLGVLISLLSRLLASPPDQQLPKVIASIHQEIETLRATRVRQKQDLERRFPDYAKLIDPKPVTLEQTRAALRTGEALISIYVSGGKTYVWAVPQQGIPTFAVVPLGEKGVTEAVTQLRKALDIGNTAISRFPRFDTAIAHRLYNELLKPVEAGWKDASSLVIVPHRALGQLPFSLLVTAPAEVGADTVARFDGYRAVPWLLRKAAVTQLPSVNALTTLRALPAAAGNRREFIGFGDPYFSKAQHAEAGSPGNIPVAAFSANLRNLRIDTVALPMTNDSGDTPDNTLRNTPSVANSSTLAQLARLPETADEIRDIAQALKANPKTDIFLGVQANEKNVKSMNLADRKVIAFATHGLVPGDLNGLEQPALALTAPDVAGIDGDGLLTMEEILALKLNADWVVLSACNTGSSDGAGSEAVSGLGRAFFYAGARSLLVSNWPVETVSARLLTADVFKRSAENPALTRAEALRQTMLWLMESAGQKDASGKMEFTYAHPMFWAPFALIGDGGR